MPCRYYDDRSTDAPARRREDTRSVPETSPSLKPQLLAEPCELPHRLSTGNDPERRAPVLLAEE